MFDVRLVFSKTGDAKYMSHLDLMRAMQRVICRARLPARYSLGFNPHIVMSLPSPLSTGFEGLNELCDFSLDEPIDFDEITARMDAAMPAGMRAIRAGAPVMKAGQIAWADFEILYPRGDAEKMRALFCAPVFVEKRSKRGAKTVDLRDYIMGISFAGAAEKTRCRTVLRADTDPLNPSYITAALLENGLVCAETAPAYIRHTVLDENMQIFF